MTTVYVNMPCILVAGAKYPASFIATVLLLLNLIALSFFCSLTVVNYSCSISTMSGYDRGQLLQLNKAAKMAKLGRDKY